MCEICDSEQQRRAGFDPSTGEQAFDGPCPEQQLIQTISTLRTGLGDELAGIRLALQKIAEVQDLAMSGLGSQIDDLATAVNELDGTVRDLTQATERVPA